MPNLNLGHLRRPFGSRLHTLSRPLLTVSQPRSFLMPITPIRVKGTASSVHEGLASLLRANAHQAFLYALSNFTPSESVAFKAAFARGLRVLAVAFAECVGPSQWGLKLESSQVRHEAKFALETLFKVSPVLALSIMPRVLICRLVLVGGGSGCSPPLIGRLVVANSDLHRLDARFDSLYAGVQEQSYRMASTSRAG